MTSADISKLPAIKFFKNTAGEILEGRKTLEPRPRGPAWIIRMQGASHVRLTYGPMMGAATVFAVARIDSVEVRGFGTATRVDIDQIGHDWPGRTVDDFEQTYTEYFASELAKGYEVAWVRFTVDPELSP
jgi:hypothetical protein